MKIIILEGLDGSGKTTLKRHIDEATNYEYIFIDRLTGSTLTYDMATGRKDRKDILLDIENRLSKDFLLVYCYAPIDVLMDRIEYKKDRLTRKMAVEQLKLFDKYLEMTPIKNIKVNTGEDIEKCVSKIKLFIKNNGG